MAVKKASQKQHPEYHKDGGVLVGYWEWFRKDGTKMRSGHFERGVQVGEWITCDKKGQIL
jgi:hypothetical protein